MADHEDPRLRLSRPLLTSRPAPGVLRLSCEDRSFLLSGVPDQLQRAVELLAEPHTISELADELPTLDAGWVGWLCEHLSTVGLLTACASRLPGPVLVHGSGRLALAILGALRSAGLAPRPLARSADLPQRPAIIVVAAAAAEPDRGLLNRLTTGGIDHLVVRCDSTRAVVGPLVRPAEGPCVRCDDLGRAQLDRSWPVALAQLCYSVVEPDPVLTGWAAAMAAVQVSAHLSLAPPELLGRTLEMGTDDFRLRTRSWPRQPACGCHDEPFVGSGTLAG